jgi:hypothetical protein
LRYHQRGVGRVKNIKRINDMSDNKFVNFYIETCVGTLQENLNNTLQLKTHLKVANDLITEKDAAIGNLMRELEEKKKVEIQYNILLEKSKAMDDELLVLRNKATHLDTALKQVADMKILLLSKDKELTSLKNTEVITDTQVKKKKKEVELEPAVNDF